MFWNFVVLCLLLYTAIFVPFQTAFIEEDTNLINQLETFMDSMFITDFVLNFLMAYEDKDKKIEVRLRYIAMNYLQGWLLVDFLSCIPFQMLSPSGDSSLSSLDQSKFLRDQQLIYNQPVPLTYSGGKHLQIEMSSNLSSIGINNIARLLRILRLFKLVRLVKYNRSINKILQTFKMNQGVKRMISVTITMLFMVHLIACLFFMIAKLNNFSPSSWVTRFNLVDKDQITQYLFAVDWAL